MEVCRLERCGAGALLDFPFAERAYKLARFAITHEVVQAELEGRNDMPWSIQEDRHLSPPVSAGSAVPQADTADTDQPPRPGRLSFRSTQDSGDLERGSTAVVWMQCACVHRLTASECLRVSWYHILKKKVSFI